MPNVATCNQLEHERQHLAVHPLEFPYRLFSITYSGSYLGLHQCIQIDSIRHAIDILYHQEIVDENQRRWLCLALCQAMSKVATTTGHFAQYLRIKEKTCRRFVAQRRRSVTLTPKSGPGGSSPMRPERWSCPSWPVPASGSRCSSGAVVGYRRSRCTRIAQPWPRAG